jgi:predicted nicotinamide N-methyase
VRGRGIGRARAGLAAAIAAPRARTLADLSASSGAAMPARAVAGSHEVSAAQVESRAGMASIAASCR